ncbi:unnamed protein product [Psylliodes chrysocephalus]|uniref:Uncharacterized protein n=1 Tax=Psylliodes chrysocephalus TaxID=3402493 RepID=A0A9P0GHA2_9CUCU|nr:unnamed protein product [Psylliodes chrysocephala]
MRLARRKQPYKVIPLEYHDFIDFKKLSRGQQILSVRTSDSGNSTKWTDIMELKVKKSDPFKIFFKNSHLQEDFDLLTLKRLQTDLEPLNRELQNLKADKYYVKGLCQ